MNIRKLSAGASHTLPFHYTYGSTDLKHLDLIRDQMRRDCARHLAEQLIREGAVQFEETLEYDPRFGGNRVHMRADLKVAA